MTANEGVGKAGDLLSGACVAVSCEGRAVLNTRRGTDPSPTARRDECIRPTLLAWRSGSASAGVKVNDLFEPGSYFDAVLYDAELPALENASNANRLATLIHTGARPCGTFIGEIGRAHV